LTCLPLHPLSSLASPSLPLPWLPLRCLSFTCKEKRLKPKSACADGAPCEVGPHAVGGSSSSNAWSNSSRIMPGAVVVMSSFRSRRNSNARSTSSRTGR
jgi:hypothetical protein